MSGICHILGDSKYGGGSKVVIGLCGRIVVEGIDVHVLTTDARLADEIKRVGGSVVTLDCIRRPISPLWDLAGLIRLVRHLNAAHYDLVHTHTSKAGMIGRLACRLAGVPAVVHTVHGFAFHEKSRPMVVSILATLERIAATWCDRLVTVSRFHREWALQLGIASGDKIIAIPNGIEPVLGVSEEGKRATRERLNVCDGELLILSLGRLAKQKGFEDLLRAVPEILSAAIVPVKIRIAGEGQMKDDLQRMIDQLDIAETVELIGFAHDIDSLLGAADLVVQPSLWEGLSISLLEAMSVGKAIVTTTIESNVEVIGDSECAVLVPPGNPAALAVGILGLINDVEARNRMAALARKVFESAYTRNRMHDQYMALYRSLLPFGEDSSRLLP